MESEFRIKKLGGSAPSETPEESPKEFSLKAATEEAELKPPKTQSKLRLRDSGADDEQQNKTQRNKCPECNADIDQGTVICVQCGTNLQSGKQLKTKAKRRKTKANKAEKSKGSFLIKIAPIVIILFVLAKFGILQKILKAIVQLMKG